jgi:hypothetical protein
MLFSPCREFGPLVDVERQHSIVRDDQKSLERVAEIEVRSSLGQKGQILDKSQDVVVDMVQVVDYRRILVHPVSTSSCHYHSLVSP